MDLLRLLADGEFHSGEELGARMGISRTAVWKQLSLWRKRGLALEVSPGKGYRLPMPLEWWSQDALLFAMSAESRALVAALHIKDRVGSTNDEALSLLRNSPESGVICLAEEQTAGRGRRGREWLSPLGGNFYGSVGWVFTGGISEVEGLSLAVGVAVLRALRRYGMQNVRLKWPNDIVVGDAKLGGVLIELQAEAEGQCLVVIGLGLNLRLPENASELLGRSVTDVATQTAADLRRNELGGLVLDELLLLLRDYSRLGFAAVREEWMQYDALRDIDVEVSGLDRELSGVASGVDVHGALRVMTASGEMLLHGGEVSLRKAPA
jgi:BirA family transcriptional regulator, biotin operon repressor / biotin---[acetyl-CoA-carboxylase] ligase